MFETHWAMSYLHGPLAKLEVEWLITERKPAVWATLADQAVPQERAVVERVVTEAPVSPAP